MRLKPCPAMHSWNGFVVGTGPKRMRIWSAISGSMRAKRLFPVTVLMAIGMIARADEAPPEAPKMSAPVRAMLTSILDAERMDALRQTLSAPDAWGSLGPHPSGAPAELPVPPPEREIELTIPDDAAGSGTADDPYLDVIGAFLERFAYPAVSIEAYQGVPAEGTVDAYMERLSYAPVIVRLPSGYYHETVRIHDSPHRHYETQRVAVDVPPGIWLKGEDEGDVVIQPVIDPETSGILFNLNIRSALLNVTLDGSTVPGFEPRPATRVTAIVAAHEALIAGNTLRAFTGSGIRAASSRGRAGSGVMVLDNLIETIGFSGIRAQSRWLIRDNQIAYAGLLRPTGGGGDDGICPAWGVDGKILNNLVLLERKPHGRHAISGQASHDYLVAGNLSITEGPLRNNIGFSDGSHRNRFIGNVALGTGEAYSGGRTLTGISVSGHGTEVRHNFIVGHPRGIRVRGRPDEAPNMVTHNYAESIVTHIYRSRNYQAEHNTFKRSGRRLAPRRFASPLPAVTAESLRKDFGLFERSSTE